MNKPEIANKLTRAFGRTKFCIQKHSPEILVVTGVVGIVGSAVLACRATLKSKDILEEVKDDLEVIADTYNDPENELSEKQLKKTETLIKARAGLKVAKEYAPAIGLGALSITCIFAGNNILHKRNVALAAAYTTIDSGFKNYRKNVIDRFGEELDKELKYNLKTQEVEETVVDEKGKEKTIKKTVEVVDPNDLSMLARIYDDGNAGWQKDPEYNLWFLKQQQAYANDKLKANGHLFLNEVYDMLGYARTKYGQSLGWFYDEKNPEHPGDNYVDFGIYETRNKRFVEGIERVCILDFNVDGPILNLI